MLISIETYNTFDFPGGVWTPYLPSGSVHAWFLWPRREKTCLLRFANNKGAYQPAQMRSLISAFIICCLESTISKPSMSEISIF